MTDTLRQKLLPVLTIVAAIGVIWYGFTVYLNAPWQLDQYEKISHRMSMTDLVRDTMAHDRPVLPAPHQVVAEIWKTTVKKKVTSKRSLIYHSWITLSSTLLGFVKGTHRHDAGHFHCREQGHGQIIDALDYHQPDNPDSGDCADDHCGTECGRAVGAVTQGVDFNLSQFLPDRRGNGLRACAARIRC